MSKRIRDRDQCAKLEAELTRAIVEKTGLKEVIACQCAQAVVSALQKTHAGGKLYIPEQARNYPVHEIKAALEEQGVSQSRVQMRFGISRSQLHKLFPGGLPKFKQTRVVVA